MKQRYAIVLTLVVGLLLATGASVLAQPANPIAPPAAAPERPPSQGPVIRIGVAWGAIVGDAAAVHNFVRRPAEELPVFTVLPGTRVRLVAGAQGLWMEASSGTLAAHLEVFDANQQAGALLGEDEVSETKAGPALAQHRLEVPVSFDHPGEVHLLARLTATGETRDGETDEDVDRLEATVIVLDPTTFGSIAGLVTADDTGQPLKGVVVTAGNRDLSLRRSARTNAEGNYVIEGLPPGDYVVGAQAKGTPYVGEIYDDVQTPEEATQVTVTPAANVTGIDFGLARGGEISGQVTDAEAGEPLAGIPIMLRRVRPADEATSAEARPAEPAPQSQDKPRPAAVTGDDGTYTVQGLRAGEYLVSAAGGRQGYSKEFWEEAATPEEATPVGIELGQVVEDVNFTLEPR